MRQLVYTMFISNSHASFHLWLKENLVKHQKVSKYYENDYDLPAWDIFETPISDPEINLLIPHLSPHHPLSPSQATDSQGNL